MAFVDKKLSKWKITPTVFKVVLFLCVLFVVYFVTDFGLLRFNQSKAANSTSSTVQPTSLPPNSNNKSSNKDVQGNRIDNTDINSSSSNNSNEEHNNSNSNDKTMTRTDYVSTFQFPSTCNHSELSRPEYVDVNTDGTDAVRRLIKTASTTPCPRILRQANFTSPRTWLLSLPGSGNTWVRHLLQQLTGIPTGAVYNDKDLRNNGFPYENRTDHVIAIKTHTFYDIEKRKQVKLRPQKDRLIVLIRNPYSTFMADYKRGKMKLEHTGNDVINPEDSAWREYLDVKVPKWARILRRSFRCKLEKIFVFYEDLLNDLLHQLIRLSVFLRNDSLTEFAFCCTLHRSEGEYHRPQSSQTEADVYTEEDRELINSLLRDMAGDVIGTHPQVAQRLLKYAMSS